MITSLPVLASAPQQKPSPKTSSSRSRNQTHDECALLREDQVLFTYLHLAADPALTHALMASGAAAIAYETVTAADGSLPLLSPMSEIAGRMSVQVGANALAADHRRQWRPTRRRAGRGTARVTVIGGGMAGANAATIALGLGADVTILDKSVSRLRWLADRFDGRARTVMANASTTREHVLDADLVVGAVLVPGARAPKLVGAEDVRDMRDGSVLVDISIDQGGCFETSRPTTHDEPTFVHEGVVHYCVTNMPGVVPRTATLALNNITLPYVRTIAEKGWRQAIADDEHLANGRQCRRKAPSGIKLWLDPSTPPSPPRSLTPPRSANSLTTLIELPYSPSSALAMVSNA